MLSSMKTGLSRSRGFSTQAPRQLPFSLEDLEQVDYFEQGNNDWKNIPEVVRTAIGGLCQGLREQDREIAELKAQANVGVLLGEIREELESKASLSDVRQALDRVVESVDDKASLPEVQTLLRGFVKEETLQAELELKASRLDVDKAVETKVEEEDFRQELTKANDRMERVCREFETLQSRTASIFDVSALKEKIDRKLDSELFKEALKEKADAEDVERILSRKADLDIVEEALEKKVDGQDLNQLINAIEKKADIETIEELIIELQNKAETKDIEMLTVAINKKADKKTFEDAQEQITVIRKEVESLFEEIEVTFGDLKTLLEKYKGDLDLCSKELAKKAFKSEITEVKTLIAKKLDGTLFIDELSHIKEEMSKEAKNNRLELDKVALDDQS